MSPRSRKQQVFDWFHRQAFEAGLLEFEEVIQGAAKLALALEDPDAEKFVLANIDRYWNWLLQECEGDAERGLHATFNVKDKMARRIRWFAADLEASASTKEKRRCLKLRAMPHMMCSIDSLSYRQYEALGCFICRLLGADRVLLTPAGNEGGIDFFASVAHPERSHVFFGPKGRLRIIGQCKKYLHRVEPSEVREMITCMDNVIHQSPPVREVVPAWFHATSGPIVGWMIGHSGFASGSKSQAKTHGIIVSDSRDLAQIASLSRRIAAHEAPAARAKTLVEKVREELALFEDGDNGS